MECITVALTVEDAIMLSSLQDLHYLLLNEILSGV
jgi:hypothetical protein